MATGETVRRGMEYDPWQHAELLGLRVEERRLKSGILGEYRHQQRLILLSPRMVHRQARSTLTHELMHAIAGDVPTPFGFLHAKQERSARIATARQLVVSDEYALAEILHGEHLDSIARELCVDQQVVADWRCIQGARIHAQLESV